MTRPRNTRPWRENHQISPNLTYNRYCQDPMVGARRIQYHSLEDSETVCLILRL